MARDGRMAGKVAIVTGAGSQVSGGIGNGRATAVVLAREGARVALVDAVRERALETRAMVQRDDGNALALEAYVSEPSQCRLVVAETVGRRGRLDCLVNNVGVRGPEGTAVEVDPAAWDRAMRINVGSVMLMSKHAIPLDSEIGGRKCAPGPPTVRPSGRVSARSCWHQRPDRRRAGRRGGAQGR